MRTDTFLRKPTSEQVTNLFDFDVLETPVYAKRADGTLFEIEGKKALVTSDQDQVLGIPTTGFVGYSYKRLQSDAEHLVNGSIKYEGAGLLYNRGVGFVQLATPEDMKSASGVGFRPFIVGTTSFNGMFRTTWGGGSTIIICRNTHMMASKQAASIGLTVKHTANSEAKLSIENVQQALGILVKIAETEAARIDALCQVGVTDAQFEAFLAKLIPAAPEGKTSRATTIRDNKRDTLWNLFQSDKRCEPGHTAWSVLQATNTFNHHYANIRGTDDRDVRNMENALSGSMGESDAQTLNILGRVLDRQLNLVAA
jgi:phage/plasmid-like protein (TIGR03299 family)